MKFTSSVPLYMLSSSSLLIVNKLAITVFPSALILLFCQLAFSSLAVSVANDIGVIQLSTLNWETLKKFWLVPTCFMFSLFCNIQILAHTNVETFIALRSSTPIILSLLDVQFLGRMLPTRKSWGAILGVMGSALLYIYFENSTLTTDSKFWLVMWYVTHCFDQIYVKHVIETVHMTMWDRVWYNNTVPLIILFPIILLFEKPLEIDQEKLFTPVLSTVFASCLLGVSMSYATFRARHELSATNFAIVGNACKFLTILFNFWLWNKHATPKGILALVACVGFSILYEQSPMDKEGKDKKKLTHFYLAVAVMAFVGLALMNSNTPINPPFRI